ncbi:MAG: phage integrase N-terminal domain-containing protein [bacterium]
MDTLAYDLKTLTLGTGEGSHTTRIQRHRGLQLVARELRGLGYRLDSARSLKPKHITALVESWRAAGLSAGTLKNRMAWVRWWGEKVRKSSVLPRDNTELGIEKRTTWKGQKAHTTAPEVWAALDKRAQLAVRLQMAFGLRLEESLKLCPAVADKGSALALQASWCKGGRARVIPITHPRQRRLLQELHAAVGGGCLVPEGQSYISARKGLERVTWAAGIRNMHGHRHWYAQWRYKSLTGQDAPAAGGKTYEQLNKIERAADYRARLTISRELGHNRIEITDAYLGRRFARGAA